jgi:hypothetical protein
MIGPRVRSIVWTLAANPILSPEAALIRAYRNVVLKSGSSAAVETTQRLRGDKTIFQGLQAGPEALRPCPRRLRSRVIVEIKREHRSLLGSGLAGMAKLSETTGVDL